MKTSEEQIQELQELVSDLVELVKSYEIPELDDGATILLLRAAASVKQETGDDWDEFMRALREENTCVMSP